MSSGGSAGPHLCHPPSEELFIKTPQPYPVPSAILANPSLHRGLWRRQDSSKPPGPAHCGDIQALLRTLGHVSHAGCTECVENWLQVGILLGWLAGCLPLSWAFSPGVGKGRSPEGPENLKSAHGSPRLWECALCYCG